MNESVIIASVMLCKEPKIVRGRKILSGCDSIWSPAEEIPYELEEYLTDELGNKHVSYGGFLQVIDLKILDLLGKFGLFTCFRCIQEKYLDHVQTCPTTQFYKSLLKNLVFVGWDICSGNGWLSASCHGCYPFNPFTGNAINDDYKIINGYGLFANLNDCQKYCKINNESILEHSPWFPVAIYVDHGSYLRINELTTGNSS
jgi:hypothetical protein